MDDNDNDADGNTTINKASISIKTPPAHGTLQIDNVTGIVGYVPNTDYTGTDSFVYTIKDNTGSESNPALVDIFVNVRPSGTNDEATTFSGNPVTILVNDNDLDKTGVTVIKGTDPSNGAVVINTDGSILYTPRNGFSGKDTFTYKLK
ncbi:MAG: type I secretion protein, partial [Chitinophagaceae bacterium]